MGSKGTNTTQNMTAQSTSSTTSPDPNAYAAYEGLLSRAQQVGSTGYTPYGGNLVQGFSPDQTTAFNTVDNLQGVSQPYIDQATSLAHTAATEIDPTHFASNIGAYMSPYTQNVVDATEANMQRSNAVQQNQVTGNAIAAGAMGGDRVGAAKAELARTQSLADNQTIAGLYNTGYQNATGELNTAANAAGQGAYSLGALGNEALSTGLSGANAQLQTGGLQQQLGQAQLSTNYQQFLQQQAYPYQQLSWLSGIINGTGPNMGSTTQGASVGQSMGQTPGPNMGSSIIGGLAALASFFKDGGRVPKAAGGGFGGVPYADGASGWIPSPVAVRAPGLPAAHAPQMQMPSAGGGGSPAAAQGLQFPKISKDQAGKIKSGFGNLFGDDGSDLSKPSANFGQPVDQGGMAALISGIDGADLSQPGPGFGQPIDFGSAGGVGDMTADLGDLGGLFARGGVVPRRGFADGGDASPFGGLADLDDGSASPVASMAVDPQFAFTADAPDAPDHGKAPAGRTVERIDPATGKSQTVVFGPKVPASEALGDGKAVAAPAAAGDDDGAPAAPIGATAAIDKAAPAEGFANAGQPRSVRNNNPGNIEDGPFAQGLPGYAGSDGRFAKFDTPDAGSAAQDRLLKSYGDRGFNTPAAIVGRWAPAAENGADSTNAYAAFVAKKLGVTPDTQIDMNDPNVRATVRSAMAAYEAGTDGQSRPIGSGAPTRALAFDGSGSSAPSGFAGIGQKVRSILPEGLGGMSDDEKAAAAASAPKDGDKSGLLGLNFSPEARQALLAAGLGMMASKSHWLGQAIGEGGLSGVATYQKAQELKRQNALANAQIANYGSEATTRAGELNIKQRAQALQEDLQKRTIAAREAAARGLAGDTGGSSGAPSIAPAPSSAPAPKAAAGAPSSPSGPSAPQAASNAPVAAPAPSGGVPAPVSAAAGEAAPQQPVLARQSDPKYLDAMADRYERAAQAAASDPETAKIYMGQAQQYRSSARAIQASGRAVDVNGNVVPLPGALDTDAAVARNKASAEQSEAAKYRLVDVQPQANGPVYKVPESELLKRGAQPVAPGAGTPPGGLPANAMVSKQPEWASDQRKKIAENEVQMQDQFRQRQIAKERLGEIAGLMKTYQTGEWAEQKADLVAKARALGLPVANSDTANPAAFQQFLKNATANVFDQAKALGGRILVTEISGLTKANANPEMQPEANRAIVGQGLGILNYEDQYYKDYMAWRRANPNSVDTSEFDTAWTAAHPLKSFTEQAKAETPAKGEQIPPPDQRKAGSLYMTPKGAARWMGNGWKLETQH